MALGPSLRERMRDTRRPAPPPLPQNALIWIVVAALVLVMVRAAWRGLLGPRCCAGLPQECQTTHLLTVEQRGDRKGTMPHRPYGIPIAKRRPTYSGPTRAAAWSGGAIVGGFIAIVIVLGFVVYR